MLGHSLFVLSFNSDRVRPACQGSSLFGILSQSAGLPDWDLGSEFGG